MTTLQKMPKNVGDLDKLIVAKGFKSCPKSNKSPNLVTLLIDHHHSETNYLCYLMTNSSCRNNAVECCRYPNYCINHLVGSKRFIYLSFLWYCRKYSVRNTNYV